MSNNRKMFVKSKIFQYKKEKILENKRHHENENIKKNIN